jgi:hypothetical protein
MIGRGIILHHSTRIGDRFCDPADIEDFDIEVVGLSRSGRASL